MLISYLSYGQNREDRDGDKKQFPKKKLDKA